MYYLLLKREVSLFNTSNQAWDFKLDCLYRQIFVHGGINVTIFFQKINNNLNIIYNYKSRFDLRPIVYNL